MSLCNGTEKEQKDAAAAIENLAWESRRNQGVIREKGGIQALNETLKSSSPEAQAYAACALHNMAATNQSEQQDMICAAGGIQTLMNVLRNGSKAAPACAAVALQSLAMCSQSQDVILGLIDVLRE